MFFFGPAGSSLDRSTKPAHRKDKTLLKSRTATATDTKASSSWTLNWKLKVILSARGVVRCHGNLWQLNRNDMFDLGETRAMFLDVFGRHVGLKFHCCLPQSQCQASQSYTSHAKQGAFSWGGFQTESSVGSGSGPYDVVKVWVDSPIDKELLFGENRVSVRRDNILLLQNHTESMCDTRIRICSILMYIIYLVMPICCAHLKEGWLQDGYIDHKVDTVVEWKENNGWGVAHDVS